MITENACEFIMDNLQRTLVANEATPKQIETAMAFQQRQLDDWHLKQRAKGNPNDHNSRTRPRAAGREEHPG